MHLREHTRTTGINTIFVFSIALFIPVLAPYIKSLGFSNVQLSILFSLMPFIMIISSPIVGRISDSIGRGAVIRTGILCEVLAILLYSFGTDWAVIAIARVLDAAAAAAVTLTVLAKIEDNVKDGVRGKYAGISLSIEYIGRIAGPLIGGIIADTFFVRAPFFVSIVILAVLIFFIGKERKGNNRISRRDFNWLGEIRNFVSHKKLRGMAILGAAMHASIPAITVFLPLLIIENMGLGYRHVGYAYFVLGMSHILQFVFGRWSDGKSYRVVLAGTAISALFLIMIAYAKSYPLLLLFLFLKGIGNSMWNISAWTLMSEVGEKERTEGEVIGTYISIAKMGSLLSFLASGFIVNSYGIGGLFMVNGIVVLIGSAAAYHLIREQPIKAPQPSRPQGP